MTPRLVVLFVAGFLAGFTFACGTPAPTCSAATCGGCCDSTGKCQSGATSEACGTDGESCGRCGTGTVCQSGECRAGNTGGGSGQGGGGGTTGGGGGGGTTGGGSGGGTTGGGSGSCRAITFATEQGNLYVGEYRSFAQSVGHYNFASWLVGDMNAFDMMNLEVVYPNDVFPTLPLTATLSAQGYSQCQVCIVYREGCSMGGCVKTYLAQAGSVTINRADRASAGRISGSGSGIRFNEWNINTDVSTGSACLELTTLGPFNVGWNADGGAIP